VRISLTSRASLEGRSIDVSNAGPTRMLVMAKTMAKGIHMAKTTRRLWCTQKRVRGKSTGNPVVEGAYKE